MLQPAASSVLLLDPACKIKFDHIPRPILQSAPADLQMQCTINPRDGSSLYLTSTAHVCAQMAGGEAHTRQTPCRGADRGTHQSSRRRSLGCKPSTPIPPRPLPQPPNRLTPAPHTPCLHTLRVTRKPLALEKDPAEQGVQTEVFAAPAVEAQMES